MSLNLSVRSVVRAYQGARGPIARAALAADAARWAHGGFSVGALLSWGEPLGALRADVDAACAAIDAGALGGAL